MQVLKRSEDMFGNPIEHKTLLRDKYIEPPFSVLDSKGGNWQKRKREWKKLGIKSEEGREATTFNMKEWADEKTKGHQLPSDTSIFDPVLCELMYRWFCPEGGSIIDPFAGGSVRGVVACYLGFKYTGIDIRPEQVDSNREQAIEILPITNQPQYYEGDSNIILSDMTSMHDMMFSCPPYADLEVYSDIDGDISNMKYEEFLSAYRSIINKCVARVKPGGYCAFVVGEIRDKKGNFVGLVPDTIQAFKDAGVHYYNEGIFLNSIASASIRAEGNMKNKKLVKVHQNVLIFRKP